LIRGQEKKMKKLIKTIEGEQLEFEPLNYKEANLIMINLNLDGTSNGEGIWGIVSDKDLELYKANATDYKFVVMLANDSLHFTPNRTWGMHIIGEMRGDFRPVADLSLVNYDDKANRVYAAGVPDDIDKDWVMVDKAATYNAMRNRVVERHSVIAKN
jgi:hypothetical protein